ncbi:hypothetical protein DL767_001156 [Monosporascus sp. MG133]|nr:hypothetical protein DL767_001156 [Monosporascus sp. MG133]
MVARATAMDTIMPLAWAAAPTTTTKPARLQEPQEDLAKNFLSPLNFVRIFTIAKPGARTRQQRTPMRRTAVRKTAVGRTAVELVDKLPSQLPRAACCRHVAPGELPITRDLLEQPQAPKARGICLKKLVKICRGPFPAPEETSASQETIGPFKLIQDKEEFSSFIAVTHRMADSLAGITEMMSQFDPDPVDVVEAVESFEAYGFDTGKSDELVLDPSKPGQRLKPHQAVDALILRRPELSG